MRKPSNAGFTLSEMLVVLGTISLLSALVISSSDDSWRRQQLNALAIELAGWLDAVRRASMKGNPCLVTITGGSLPGGATLATASEVISSPTIANTCLDSRPLQISSTFSESSSYTISPNGNTSFKFTPRGTVNGAAADAQLTSPIVIEISLTGSSGPLRCVRISEGLGLISIGSSNASSTTCPSSSYGGAI